MISLPIFMHKTVLRAVTKGVQSPTLLVFGLHALVRFETFGVYRIPSLNCTSY